MGHQAQKLSMLLVKQQAVFGTAEAALASIDVVETIGPATIGLNPNMTQIELVAGAFSQDSSVPGVQELDLAMKVYGVTAGSGGTGQCGMLLGLCGLVDTNSPSGTHTYAFTSALASMKDFTAWLYSGNLDSNGCILRKCQNGVFSPKWTFETGKPVVMDLGAKLGYVAIPAVATQPSITKQLTIPPAMLGATIKINNVSTFQLLSAEIDAGQAVVLTRDPSKTYGTGVSNIGDRKIKWTAKCYQDIPANGDPETALQGMTNAAWEITYGTVPQKFSWKSTYGQITDIKEEDAGGTTVWTLSGIFVQNNFSHIVQTA
jgi:hypothetical protein